MCSGAATLQSEYWFIHLPPDGSTAWKTLQRVAEYWGANRMHSYGIV